VASAAVLGAVTATAGCGQVSATGVGSQAGAASRGSTAPQSRAAAQASTAAQARTASSPSTGQRTLGSRTTAHTRLTAPAGPTPRPSRHRAKPTTKPRHSTSAVARQGPAFVVTRFHHLHVYDGNVYFSPPPTGIRPAVSGARAFALARKQFPDPHGSATPVVALALYTNDGQGTTLPGGGLRRFNVRRLTWVVIDDGADCLPVLPPAPIGSPAPAELPFHDCLFLTFVDATTGADDGMTDEGGPAVRDLTTG